jgi:hypothetical protein
MVVRAVAELPAVLAIANADIAVLVVLHLDAIEHQRVTDVLAGWSSGAGVALDWLGANTVTLRSPRATSIRLISHGLADATERALSAASTSTLTRDDEPRLWSLAAAGSPDARRRLIDAYAEIATLVAMWLRPRHLPVPLVTRYAHEELDAVVGSPSTTPLLVTLVNRIAERLGSPRR